MHHGGKMTTRSKITFPVWGILTLIGVLFGGVAALFIIAASLVAGGNDVKEKVPWTPTPGGADYH